MPVMSRVKTVSMEIEALPDVSVKVTGLCCSFGTIVTSEKDAPV